MIIKEFPDKILCLVTKEELDNNNISIEMLTNDDLSEERSAFINSVFGTIVQKTNLDTSRVAQPIGMIINKDGSMVLDIHLTTSDGENCENCEKCGGCEYYDECYNDFGGIDDLKAILALKNMEHAISFSKTINNKYISSSVLYKHKDIYYLVLTFNTEEQNILQSFYDRMLEYSYSDDSDVNNYSRQYLLEHGTKIINKNAIEILKGL